MYEDTPMLATLRRPTEQDESPSELVGGLEWPVLAKRTWMAGWRAEEYPGKPRDPEKAATSQVELDVRRKQAWHAPKLGG